MFSDKVDMDSADKVWPPLSNAYADEFGEVQPEVYDAAGELWPQALSFAQDNLGDISMGRQLMFKASALVTRKLIEQPDHISTLKGYLWQTYRRLVLTEKGKSQRLYPLDVEAEGRRGISTNDPDEEILIQEVRRRMDEWTRLVFELRVIGYDYEEIAQMLGTRANRVRSKFDKQIKKLAKHLKF